MDRAPTAKRQRDNIPQEESDIKRPRKEEEGKCAFVKTTGKGWDLPCGGKLRKCEHDPSGNSALAMLRVSPDSSEFRKFACGGRQVCKVHSVKCSCCEQIACQDCSDLCEVCMKYECVDGLDYCVDCKKRVCSTNIYRPETGNGCVFYCPYEPCDANTTRCGKCMDFHVKETLHNYVELEDAGEDDNKEEEEEDYEKKGNEKEFEEIEEEIAKAEVEDEDEEEEKKND